ncbi:MAG: polysaccharide biosynthesis/export family protein [Gemmatimonadota bacterium]
MGVLRLLVVCLLGGLLLPMSVAQPAPAQRSVPDYESRTSLEEKRSDLERRLSDLDRGSDERARVQEQLAQVRRRLTEGDFRPGDAVEIRVPQSDTLSGVFQVDAGPLLRVPTIGEIDLGGVLYSEADSVIREEMRRYVRSERIDVRPLKRVAVLGAVGDPGYYDVAPSVTISDLLMRAGGPTQGSDLEKLELRRDGRTIASAEKGLRESSTLAELGVERGDQVRIPQQSQGTSFGTIMSVIGAVSTVAFAATRIF